MENFIFCAVYVKLDKILDLMIPNIAIVCVLSGLNIF